MSLKFGIYLVEQRIISPEQFCGLIKIQQESALSLPTVAIRRNVLTIKQVAKVLTLVESNPSLSFLETAIAENLLDRVDVDRLLHEQQYSTPSIRKLAVECGLLTDTECGALYKHFGKRAALSMQSQLPKPTSETGTTEPADITFTPPQPKFVQRPVETRQYTGQP